MNKLTILVDLDDTLENLCETWVDELNRRHELSVTMDDITQWDMTKAFPTLSREQIYQPLVNAELWKRVTPLPEAPEYLKRIIDDGHEVWIVTASYYTALGVKLDNTLFKHFPYITPRNVITAYNKQMIKGDIMIDDAPHNLEGARNLKILVDAPHNRAFDESTIGAVRAKSWQDIYEFVLEYTKKIGGVGIYGGITLYSNGCPRCEVLKKKLTEKGVPFVENNSVDEMIAMGITNVPVLSNNGELMDFLAAVDWVNKQ